MDRRLSLSLSYVESAQPPAGLHEVNWLLGRFGYAQTFYCVRPPMGELTLIGQHGCQPRAGLHGGKADKTEMLLKPIIGDMLNVPRNMLNGTRVVGDSAIRFTEKEVRWT